MRAHRSPDGKHAAFTRGIGDPEMSLLTSDPGNCFSGSLVIGKSRLIRSLRRAWPTYGGRAYGYWLCAVAASTGFSTRTFATSVLRRLLRCCGRGVCNYTYVTRATTPGQFVVPPAKA